MLEMTPERWNRMNKIQHIVWNMAQRFRDNRCKGRIKNLAARERCPHVVVDMLDGSRVSLTYFGKRKEVQVFDSYGDFRCEQNIWVFKRWENAVDFVIRGLKGYNDVIEHRLRNQTTSATKTLIHRKHTQKVVERCHH
ncbi:hypothetical protein MYOV003v1_p0179 [Vibrio phage 207E48.1]|nr:hypothetical protein MYOV003v1_p0179 [Vibrio phage 207E48.1]